MNLRRPMNDLSKMNNWNTSSARWEPPICELRAICELVFPRSTHTVPVNKPEHTSSHAGTSEGKWPSPPHLNETIAINKIQNITCSQRATFSTIESPLRSKIHLDELQVATIAKMIKVRNREISSKMVTDSKVKLTVSDSETLKRCEICGPQRL